MDTSKDYSIEIFKEPFPHLVIDNFLDDNECDELIKKTQGLFDDFEIPVQHGNRRYVMNTTIKFEDFINKHNVWKNFHSQLSSQTFFDFIMAKLNEADSEFYNSTVIDKKMVVSEEIKVNPNGLKGSLLRKGYQQIQTASIKGFAAYKFYSVLRKINFYLGTMVGRFSSSQKVQLLFDISQASNGYGRSVHRDSDGRIIVFLYYMNGLDNNGVGGDFNIHGYTGLEDNPFPKDDESPIVKSVKPKKNRLVAFLNSDISYHSVEKMAGHNSSRLFCYGGFTSLARPLIKLTNKMKTEMSDYL